MLGLFDIFTNSYEKENARSHLAEMSQMSQAKTLTRPSSAPIIRASASTPSRPKRPSSADPRKKRQPPDEETLKRLAKPISRRESEKQLSGIFQECKECVFRPTISEQSKEFHLPAFVDRLPGYIKDHFKCKNQNPARDPEATFKPALDFEGLSLKKVEGTFLERMQKDFEERQKKREVESKKQHFSYQPTISSAKSKRYAEKLDGDFLSRVQNDLDTRYENTKKRVQDSLHLPYSFTPSIASKVEPKQPFLSRMENDIDDREERYKMNVKMLRLPLSKRLNVFD